LQYFQLYPWAIAEFEKVPRLENVNIIKLKYNHENGDSSKNHICEINNLRVAMYGISDNFWIKNEKVLVSGESTIGFPIIYYDESSNTLNALNESQLQIETIPRISATSKGVKTVLAIRANAKDTSTSMDLQAMISRIYESKYSLRRQYKKCSVNQLKLLPFEGKTSTGVNVENGVGEVFIDINVKGSVESKVEREMVNEANAKYGNLSAQFDFVIFCMPPGTGDWLAYASVNGWKSVYNDKWCDNLTVLQHEVGHNINLGHSGEGNPDYGYYMYGDESCPMGFGSYNTHYVEEGTERPRCFNGAKSWQLGWYEKGHVTITPSSPTFKGKLIGVVNYKKLESDHVLVRIQGNTKDYYVAFNHKAKYNSMPLEGANQVMITSKKGSPSSNWDSHLEARLGKGDNYIIEGTYKVKILKINKSGRAYAKIKISVEKCSSNSDCIDSDPCIVGKCSNEGFCVKEQDCSTCGKKPVLVEVVTDNYPEKTSWNIISNNQTVVEYGSFKDKFAMYNKRACLGNGNYTFTMNKSGLDVCCPKTREGYFALSVNNNLLERDVLSSESAYKKNFSI